MNTYQLLAHIKAVTGHSIRLGLCEEIANVKITSDIIAVSVRRVHGYENRSGFHITKRGLDVRTYIEQPDGLWSKLPTTVVWWSTRELHTSRDARTPDREWEDMCHRPGTESYPMDNLDRVEQKQLLGY